MMVIVLVNSAADRKEMVPTAIDIISKKLLLYWCRSQRPHLPLLLHLPSGWAARPRIVSTCSSNTCGGELESSCVDCAGGRSADSRYCTQAGQGSIGVLGGRG